METALSIYLENFATSIVSQRTLEILTSFFVLLVLFQTSSEQLAVAEFANSLLVIPRTLSVNAALDSTDLIAKLRAFHNASQTMSERKELKWSVLDAWFCLQCTKGVCFYKASFSVFRCVKTFLFVQVWVGSDRWQHSRQQESWGS